MPGLSADRAAAVPGAPDHLPASPAQPVVNARAGQIGHEMGIEIARHLGTGGDKLTVRLNPAEMGRIEVCMSFNEHGSLRAVVAAESPAVLDMLHRDSTDLSRSLTEAGIQSDAQSFRFDSRSSGGGGGQSWQRQQPDRNSQPDSPASATQSGGGDLSQDSFHRPVRTSGRVDLMA